MQVTAYKDPVTGQLYETQEALDTAQASARERNRKAAQKEALSQRLLDLEAAIRRVTSLADYQAKVCEYLEVLRAKAKERGLWGVQFGRILRRRDIYSTQVFCEVLVADSGQSAYELKKLGLQLDCGHGVKPEAWKGVKKPLRVMQYQAQLRLDELPGISEELAAITQDQEKLEVREQECRNLSKQAIESATDLGIVDLRVRRDSLRASVRELQFKLDAERVALVETERQVNEIVTTYERLTYQQELEQARAELASRKEATGLVL